MKKQTDPSSGLAKLLQLFGDSLSASIRVALPCEVISFDRETQTASVRPLIRPSDDIEPAPIESVRVLSHRFVVEEIIQGELKETVKEFRAELLQGDRVFVVFADQEIKNALQGQSATPDSSRRHSLMDGVIAGVFL